MTTTKKRPAITDLASATPVAIDTRLSELDADWFRASAHLASRIDDAHRLNGERATWVSRSRKSYPTDATTALAQLTAKFEAGEVKPWDASNVTRVLADVAKLRDAIKVNRTEFNTLEAEYERRPWQRYISVMGGHIHSGYWCAGGTIRQTTIRQWTPSLSGKKVADAVAELGPLLCTHCFPEAPVEWQAGHAKPVHCAGSGRREKPGTYKRQGMSGYGRCQECDTNQTVTTRGAIRAHKPATNDTEK